MAASPMPTLLRALVFRLPPATSACPQIIEYHLMTGGYDYLLHVFFRDAEEHERLHRSVLSRLPNVTRINSGFAIRRVPRTTAIPLDV